MVLDVVVRAPVLPDSKTLAHLHSRFARTRGAPVVNPPADAQGWRWVEPRYVGEVAFREWAPGRGLRHASWKGLREQIDPRATRLPSVI